MENIIQFENVTKVYGNTRALNNVSLSIGKGKIVGLLGPNGSGKTTMIKILTGLIHDYKGHVEVSGQPLSAQTNQWISYLPDKQMLPSWFKVKEVIALFHDFYPDFDRDKAEEMMNAMDVPLQRKIRGLSKGMQEKLQLSLTMSRRASLYILDEPIAAVDPAARDFIMKTILRNYGDGSSMLISTHIISDIESALDEVVFLKKGEVLLQSNAENLRAEKQQSIDELFRALYSIEPVASRKNSMGEER